MNTASLMTNPLPGLNKIQPITIPSDKHANLLLQWLKWKEIKYCPPLMAFWLYNTCIPI